MFNIELSDREAQAVLSIRTRSSMENLPQTIGEAYGKIMQYMTELGIQPADAPFTAYYNMDMEDLDMEIGFPVSRQLQGRGDIEFREIPAGKYASCMYTGPYSQMEQPYNEMFKWMKDNGYEPKGICYEFYYNSPAEVPESELLTMIVMPVK